LSIAFKNMATPSSLPDSEDRRTYVDITTNLSSQLISAALAIIAVEGAFVTFVLDKKVPNTYFYFWIVASFILFIFSIFFGGKGIDFLKDKLLENPSSINKLTGSKCFNAQALLSSLALVFFIISFIVFLNLKDKPSDNTLQQSIESLIKKIEATTQTATERRANASCQ
jgi:membrane protein implicated in regulation of membrane protease activity